MIKPREHGSRRAGAATIRDVARAAGVGLGTVSRALGSGELVKPSTRARIVAAAERIGYRPSRAAKVLRGVRARILGVMIPDLSLPLYAHWLRGASEAASTHGYVLLVCDGQNSSRVIDQQLERLYVEQIDGLVVAGPVHGLPRIQAFVDAGIAVVPEVARQARRALRKTELREPSERAAALSAFRRLVALGHRRIAYVAHVERDQRFMSPMQRFRIACLRESLSEKRATLDEHLVVTAVGPGECRERVAELLASRDRPTAFVPGTEALTPAVLVALAAAGLEVPRDASVCGFGDSLWEQAFRPPISVVRFDYEGVARAMIENVIARIEGVRPVPPVPAFPSEFVERGSCAPPPRRGRRRTA